MEMRNIEYVKFRSDNQSFQCLAKGGWSWEVGWRRDKEDTTETPGVNQHLYGELVSSSVTAFKGHWRAARTVSGDAQRDNGREDILSVVPRSCLLDVNRRRVIAMFMARWVLILQCNRGWM